MKKESKQIKAETVETHSYSTGSTKPPKSYGGVVALLLVLVILLGGIFSALGVLNIQLSKLLEQIDQDKSTVAFSQNDEEENGDAPSSDSKSDKVSWLALGMAGETVSEAYRQYYNLPAGVCITEIAPQGAAAAAGVKLGDVLTGVNDQSIRTAQDLTDALAVCEAGRSVMLLISRGGTNMSVVATVAKD